MELALAFGASRWEAARPVVQRAGLAGAEPLLRCMRAAGLVTLPVLMSGMLLAGDYPSQVSLTPCRLKPAVPTVRVSLLCRPSLTYMTMGD